MREVQDGCKEAAAATARDNEEQLHIANVLIKMILC
jgi:hypothetical protein